jgi:hypothetical protein
MTGYEQAQTHRLRVRSGRDPNERHRAATPLELLYDLTFVVAFGVAAEQFAHLLAEGHFAAGLAALAWQSSRFVGHGSTSPGSHRRTTPTTGRSG